MISHKVGLQYNKKDTYILQSVQYRNSKNDNQVNPIS